MSAKTNNWRWISPLAFGLAVILFVASAHTSHGRDLRGGDHGDLVALIHSQQSQASHLTADVLTLSKQTQHLTRVQIDATLAAQEGIPGQDARKCVGLEQAQDARRRAIWRLSAFRLQCVHCQ